MNQWIINVYLVYIYGMVYGPYMDDIINMDYKCIPGIWYESMIYLVVYISNMVYYVCRRYIYIYIKCYAHIMQTYLSRFGLILWMFLSCFVCHSCLMGWFLEVIFGRVFESPW